MSDFISSTIQSDTQRRSLKRAQNSLIFVGGMSVEPNRDLERIQLPVDSKWLNTAQINDWVQITQMHLDKNTFSHLCNLGLTPGTVAEVVSKTASGSVIVRINRQQIGLGAEIVCRLIVNCIYRQNNEN